MFFLAMLIIGLFFATCMLLVEPLFLFWSVPLVLPFVCGAAIAWILGRRGWFGLLSSRRAMLLGLLGLPGAIAVPYTLVLTDTWFSMPAIELPRDAIVLHRTVDAGAIYMAFRMTDDFDTAKAHFRDSLGVTRWRDHPTLDPQDDPAVLMQSHLLDGVEGLHVLIYDCAGTTCVEVGWSRSISSLVYLIALLGAMALLAMIALGPPYRESAG
jgi:membrane glycosyltransferase